MDQEMTTDGLMRWHVIWGQAICPRFFIYAAHPHSTVRFSIISPLRGDAVRLRFSNIYGKEPYLVGACTVKAGTRVTVTQLGQSQFAVPCGQTSCSDAAELDVASGETLEISLYVVNRLGEGNTIEPNAQWAKGRNLAHSDAYPPLRRSRLAEKFNSYAFVPTLEAIEVRSQADPAVIVALGDSITQQSMWTQPLAARLFEHYQDRALLINKGIGGNRIRYSGRGLGSFFGEAAQERLDRDIFGVPGVKTVILALGTNDIGWRKRGHAEYATTEQLAAALQAMTARLAARGLKVVGTTILPRMQSMGYQPDHEDTRQALNAWIRSFPGFAHVIDFDEVIRRPDKPGWMIPAYHCGDYLHPSRAGGEAMAEAFDLEKLV